MRVSDNLDRQRASTAWLTTISPGPARCMRRAARFTASPMTV